MHLGQDVSKMTASSINILSHKKNRTHPPSSLCIFRHLGSSCHPSYSCFLIIRCKIDQDASSIWCIRIPVCCILYRTKFGSDKLHWLSICLSVCLSVCIFVCLFVCLFVYLFVCVPVCLSVSVKALSRNYWANLIETLSKCSFSGLVVRVFVFNQKVLGPFWITLSTACRKSRLMIIK